MRRFVFLLFAIGLLAVVGQGQDWRAIDTANSTLTIRAYKSGLLSGLAHNHEIRARVAAGRVSLAPEAVELKVETARLEVLDPGLAADKRAEIQQRMLGAEVLDTATYPVISFSSQSVRKTGDNRWRVTGELTLHGQTHPVSVEVTRAGDNFRGSAAVLQHEFGIKPVSVAGGAGKVKDQVAVEFDIRLATQN